MDWFAILKRVRQALEGPGVRALVKRHEFAVMVTLEREFAGLTARERTIAIRAMQRLLEHII